MADQRRKHESRFGGGERSVSFVGAAFLFMGKEENNGVEKGENVECDITIFDPKDDLKNGNYFGASKWSRRFRSL
jgi:hypothetical protein